VRVWRWGPTRSAWCSWETRLASRVER
jgi:hypothetical protein